MRHLSDALRVGRRLFGDLAPALAAALLPDLLHRSGESAGCFLESLCVEVGSAVAAIFFSLPGGVEITDE